MPQQQIDQSSLQFHPIKIVAEPWRGKHNVYAVFAIPLKYKDIYDHLEVLVKGNNTLWDVSTNDVKYGVTAPDDCFLAIGYVRTRIALWYLITGRFSILQNPCNWTLYLREK